ncbi:MAG: hypothetical protein M1133_05010 [Armatimonadetes bacterium]|nr:hypothetical protein [Armatimonadota bacterium]
MNSINYPEQNTPRFTMPIRLWVICVTLIAIGGAGLAIAFIATPKQAWLWLLIGFVSFTGIANGMLAWAAAFRVAKARWTPAINRLGHAALAFAPVSAVALIVLLAGVGSYAPWVRTPVPEKEAWLNVPFFIMRELALLGGYWILSLVMVRWSLKCDAKAMRGEEITDREQFRLSAIAVAVVMGYAVTSTVVAWDFIMSLSPEWFSTMFGTYYFCANAYVSLAVIALLMAFLRGPLGIEDFTRPQQFKDIGNLMLAFALFDMGLFFAQYLTIWYENLPEEVGFLILRYHTGPWPWPGWVALIIQFGLPFIVLQSRKVKQTARLISIIAVPIILGYLLERYVLIVPSIFPAKLIIAPVGALSLLAFLGAFVLTVVLFLAKYQPVCAAQLALGQAEVPLEESL